MPHGVYKMLRPELESGFLYENKRVVHQETNVFTKIYDKVHKVIIVFYKLPLV